MQLVRVLAEHRHHFPRQGHVVAACMGSCTRRRHRGFDCHDGSRTSTSTLTHSGRARPAAVARMHACQRTRAVPHQKLVHERHVECRSDARTGVDPHRSAVPWGVMGLCER